MRRQRILITLAALLVGVIVLQQPAAADCAGPTLQYETGEFAPGGLVRVTGSAFGNNCYDTGPPPEGEGVLGVPVSDIEILLVQGDMEWVVAMGNAGNDYSFIVEVQIPLDASPGEARITARWNVDWEPYIPATEALVITDGAPTAEAIDLPVFGAEPTPQTVEETAEPVAATEDEDDDPDDDPDRTTWIAAGLVIAAAAIGGLLLLSKR